jgi:hypothetical protein
MAGMDALEKLVTSLSLEERRKMLEKLQAQSSLSAESLYPASPANEAEPVLSGDEQYAKLPWYYRLCYFILGLFKNKAPCQVFIDGQIGGLGRRIDLEYPDFYQYQQGILLAESYRLLAALKEDARFFFDALDSSVNRDRGCFFSFLGSLEMADVHRALETETAPERLGDKMPDAELRQAAQRAMEEVFARITEAQRATMYGNARSLYCLKELASFLYDRILLAFSSTEGGQTCSIYLVKDMLGSLNNILFSLKAPPSLALLESLFIFILQEKSGEPEFDHDQALGRFLHRAESALANIRNFNRRLPLTLILKCGNRDMAYAPRLISGGEDWYAVYRDYWKRRVNARCAAYIKNRRYRELREDCKNFFRESEPVNLENAASEEGARGFPLSGALSLAFLLSFHKLVFLRELNPCLMLVLADGEFLNRENRIEFTGSYNDLARLGTDIQGLDEKIGPQGIYSERYTQIWQDIASSLPVKRRKIQLLLEDAAEESGRIVERARAAIDAVFNIVTGILKKNTEGRYDSLSNLSELEIKFPDFQTVLQAAGDRLRETAKILDTAAALEAETAKNQGGDF